MNIKGNAVVLTNGKFNSKSAKTAHGLLRGSKRFNVVAVIDSSFSEKYVHIDKNGKIDLLDSVSDIPIFKDINSFLQSSLKVDYCIIGVASAGGLLPDKMRGDVILSLKNGISIINGLHSILNEDEELVKISNQNNSEIFDIRASRPRNELSFWSGKIHEVKVPKIVVLGTDCGLGKRTTAKLVVENLEKNNIISDMVYTGQTGWMQGWENGFIIDST